jgi:hypothetical protein
MAEINERKIERRVRREIRSPRTAAFAGMGYSILMITGMLLASNITSVRLEDVTLELLESWSRRVSLILYMIPIAGLLFLWFTGVIRERLGELEDRFFATIFYGSGIIQVVLLFIWGSIFGALMVSKQLITAGLTDSRIYIFGFALMNEIIGNYALRMAGVYMTAINALFSKTGLMPRWLSIINYILAMGFLFAAERIREARFIFPAWVFLMSVYILILNLRRTYDQEPEAV